MMHVALSTKQACARKVKRWDEGPHATHQDEVVSQTLILAELDLSHLRRAG